MKATPAALTSHYQLETTTVATLWKITRTDGQVYGFTSHDKDLVVAGITYSAVRGFDPSDIATKLGYGVDDLELTGAFDSLAINEADLVAGKWDYAAIEVYRVNWNSPSDGVEKLRRGWFGQIRQKDFGFVTEVRGLMQPLQQDTIELSSPACRAILGDARCKVVLSPATWAATTAVTVRQSGDGGTGDIVKGTALDRPWFKCSTAGTTGGSEPTWDTTLGNTTSDGTAVWTAIAALSVPGTVTSVTDQRSFAASGVTEAATFFEQGVVEWLTGNNAGLKREIKTHGASGAFGLTEPMPYAIQVGDTFQVSAGCRKRVNEDCRDKFDNIRNFRGEPHRPTLDTVLAGPLGE